MNFYKKLNNRFLVKRLLSDAYRRYVFHIPNLESGAQS